MIVAVAVTGLLLLASYAIAKRVARSEGDPRYFKLLMWGAVLHMAFAPLSITIVAKYFGGLTDYSQYVGQGVILAHNFDAFHFTLAGTKLTSPVGSGGVSIATGLVFAVLGVNKLVAFLIFGWWAFLGSVCFFKAFALTFPEGGHRRYAFLIFFLPSILFWTAGVSKESMMYVSLGVTAYGAARLLAHRPGGVILIALGSALGLYVRPQELLLLLGAIAAASLFRRRSQRSLSGLRSIGIILVQVALVLAAFALTKQVRGPVFSLNQVANLNSGAASSVPYSSSPLAYPRDVYEMLFNPLGFNAHTTSQYIASIENLVILGLLVTSWRRLRHLGRVMVLRPYVMASVLYTAAALYAFAALANLGLMDRERVLILPFLLVLVAIPIAPKNSPPIYEWENPLRRSRRKSKGSRWSPRPSLRY